MPLADNHDTVSSKADMQATVVETLRTLNIRRGEPVSAAAIARVLGISIHETESLLKRARAALTVSCDNHNTPALWHYRPDKHQDTTGPPPTSQAIPPAPSTPHPPT